MQASPLVRGVQPSTVHDGSLTAPISSLRRALSLVIRGLRIYSRLVSHGWLLPHEISQAERDNPH